MEIDVIKTLKEKEEKLNNICRNKGFELTIVNNENGRGKILIKKLNNSANIEIQISSNSINNEVPPYNEYISIIDSNTKEKLKEIKIYDIPKWIYNYFNCDKIKYEYEFIGGEYDGQIMNREEIEKISINTISKTDNLTFEEFITYQPIIQYYFVEYKIEFGKICLTYVENYPSSNYENIKIKDVVKLLEEQKCKLNNKLKEIGFEISLITDMENICCVFIQKLNINKLYTTLEFLLYRMDKFFPIENEKILDNFISVNDIPKWIYNYLINYND